MRFARMPQALNNIFLFLICFAVFFSCKTAPKEKRLFTNITNNSKFYLMQTEDIERTMDMAQQITAEFREQKYFLLAWVKADKNAIEMAFFNELGAGIGELSYKDGAVNFSSTVVPKAALRYFKPEYIIADFQLCFYDPVLLEKSLEDCGLVLEVQGDNRRGSRRILDGSEVVIEIIKTANSVKLNNNLRGYAFTFEGDFL